jgi:stage IV sporulation protein FB
VSDEPGWSLGSFKGTTLRVEPTFLILSGFFIASELDHRVPLSVALLWLPILFISVLAHEAGHAALFAAFGFGPSHIYLGGFGGRTVNPGPTTAGSSILISLAGPVSSLFLSVVAFLVLWRVDAARSIPLLKNFFESLAEANLVWGLLNLAPIYPLDGGSIVFSAARLVMSLRAALLLSVISSLLFAVLLGGLALFTRQLFVALFAALFAFQNLHRWRQWQGRGAAPTNSEVEP